MLTSGFLRSLRLKAIRRRVYYRVLGRLDRGILELSTRVVDQVRSAVLLKQLFEIVATLEEALKSRFTKHLESFGFKRVVQTVKQAVRFGYRDASEWIMDRSFAVYLTVQNLNQPPGYRVEVS